LIDQKSQLIDVAFTVCTAMQQAGIVAVLTGGSAATVYAPHAYQSRDCDFIISMAKAGANGNVVMNELGYKETGGTFSHINNRYTVEFPKGPLSVGDEIIAEWKTLHRELELLHILAPTDCCRDRLAGYYHWNDFSSLEQALAVAKSQSVDIDRIAEWSRREGEEQKLKTFMELVAARE
jgi:hypothetical protein